MAKHPYLPHCKHHQNNCIDMGRQPVDRLDAANCAIANSLGRNNTNPHDEKQRSHYGQYWKGI
ncbi:MAG: hypothetical protein AAGA75_06890 [Cyanobacteria bacterium P01_E01_bin.6]